MLLDFDLIALTLKWHKNSPILILGTHDIGRIMSLGYYSQMLFDNGKALS